MPENLVAAYRRGGSAYDYSPKDGHEADYYLLPAEDALLSERDAKQKEKKGGGLSKLLWVPAVAVLAALLAKAYLFRADSPAAPSLPPPAEFKPADDAAEDLFPAHASPASLGELTYTQTDERRQFHSRAPLLTQEDGGVATDPSTRPRSVPFALGFQQDDQLPLDSSELPRAWLLSKEGGAEGGASQGRAEGEEKPGVLGWLSAQGSSEQAGDGAEEQEKPREVPSSDAFNRAKQLDLASSEAGQPLLQEDQKSALKRRFSRVLAKIGSGQEEQVLQTVMEAVRLSPLVWDARARHLRAELLLAETLNDVLRLQERQEKAWAGVQQQAAGEAGKAAEEQYLSLLEEEEMLLASLQSHIGLWNQEVETILTNMASVLTSPSFKDVEALGTCQGGLMGMGKATVKLGALGASMPKETRSKVKAVYVLPLVEARLEEVRFRKRNVAKLSSPNAVAAISKMREKAKFAKEESRKTLAKKKAAADSVVCSGLWLLTDRRGQEFITQGLVLAALLSATSVDWWLFLRDMTDALFRLLFMGSCCWGLVDRRICFAASLRSAACSAVCTPGGGCWLCRSASRDQKRASIVLGGKARSGRSISFHSASF
ncbi:hypothetical protein Efla_004378 [Eimeria flavescens]